MSRPSPVTPEERQRMLDLYATGLSLEAVAAKVGYSGHTVKKQVLRAGITIRIARRVETVERDQMIELYRQGKNTYEIGRLLGRPGGTVVVTLRKAGVKTRDIAHCGKRLSVKEDYFQHIDTSTKAYLLGFIYADGNVKGNRFKLALWDKDEALLKAVARELGFDGHLYREAKRGPKRSDMLSLTIFGRDFVNHLRDKGVIDNKTNRLTFPTFLSSDLVVHFIHGLLDGDGCICLYRNKSRPEDDCQTTSIAGCYVLLEGVHRWFADLGVVGHLRHNKKNPLSGNLLYSGTKALVVANIIYNSHQSIYLIRKKDKYKDMITRLNTRRQYKRADTVFEIDLGLSILNHEA